MALTDGDRAYEQHVRIDVRFIREQANTAVRQFFQPITAPFLFATGRP